MVKIFLVFQSISFTSSFINSVMPAPYRTVGTIHVFIAWNTCFAFNFDFNVALNLLKYFFLMFLFISFRLMSFFSKIPRYVYPPFLTPPIYSPFSKSVPLHSTSLSLFIAKTPHLSIPNFIPMSFVTISTVLVINLILVFPIELQVVHNE